MNRGDFNSIKSQEKIYLICKYCNTPIEQSCISSHLHVCPSRTKKNEILEIIQRQDPNEEYIPAGHWPAAFPHTPEVIEYIRNSGCPPIDMPPVED